MELGPLLFCSGEDDTADDNPESQEMLEEQLVRMLTREVMDLISKWHGGCRDSREDFFWGKELVAHLIPLRHVYSITDRWLRNNELDRNKVVLKSTEGHPMNYRLYCICKTRICGNGLK